MNEEIFKMAMAEKNITSPWNKNLTVSPWKKDHGMIIGARQGSDFVEVCFMLHTN